MMWVRRVAMVLLLAATAATAGDDELYRPSLKGLKGVGVVVEDLQADVERDGLDKTSIQTDVELKLRQAGITVLTEAERLAAPGRPFVYINVGTYNSGSMYAHSSRVEFRQDVRLDRDPNIQIPTATTWSAEAVGAVGRNDFRAIRDSIKDCVDRFINAYLSVNPKK